MIRIVCTDSGDSAVAVLAAGFARSITPSLVSTVEPGSLSGSGPLHGVFAAVSPGAADGAWIRRALAGCSKLLVFGRSTPEVAALIALTGPRDLPANIVEAGSCPPAPLHEAAASRLGVSYTSHPLADAAPLRHRPLLRYDYADEWNNLGYGRIAVDRSIWSLACGVDAAADTVLAWAGTAQDPQLLPVATLHETVTASVLWWNRAVGPVDSPEWMLVESFLADWHAGGRPCVPVVEEIPFGFDAAATMRLDCDEDIASARPLFDLYRSRGIPFSLAVMTGQEDRPEHRALLQEVHAAGGSILSHSSTHAPRWGGSEEAAEREAASSRAWLEKRVAGLQVRHAVSPFHQNPAYVPRALAQAGIEAFVGGSVAWDPEALLARGGTLPGDDSGVVTHSQQCMLHGDCMQRDEPIATYKDAFRLARRARAIFGYLDHPLSARYDYGWGTEGQRLARHRELLDCIEAETADATVWRASEDDCLSWIRTKAQLRLTQADGRYELMSDFPRRMEASVRYRGQRLPLSTLIGRA